MCSKFVRRFGAFRSTLSTLRHEMGIVALGCCGRLCGEAGTWGYLTGWRQSSGPRRSGAVS